MMKKPAEVVKELNIGNEELLRSISTTMEKVAKAGMYAGISEAKRIAEAEGNTIISLKLSALLYLLS